MKITIFHAKTFKDSSAALMKALAEGPSSPETRKILLVPDKLTLSAETEVLYASQNGGTFNTFVYSFTRLCSVIARGAEKGKYLNKQSSVELFSRIIAENKAELKCFGNSADRPGFAEIIYNTVNKLRYCLITPDALRKFGGAGQLKAKTEDIAFLYEKYNEYIKDRFFDSSTKLDILYGLLDGAEELRGAHIYLKDYDNFSRQEMRIIKKMTGIAESVSVACAYDGGNPYLYKNEIYHDILSVAEELGITPVLIDGNNPSDTLIEHIKKELFSYGKITAAEHSGRVKIHAAADAFREADAAARYICGAVRGGARYKDFSVVTASLDSYRLPLIRAFSNYGVPCYLDEGINLSVHALGKFLTAVASAKTEGLTLRSALPVVKNYFGSPKLADAFENYALKHNVRGFSKAFEDGKYSRAAEEVRKTLVDTIKKFDIPDMGKIEDFTAAVRVFLTAVNAEDKIAALASEERLAGIEARARVTEQVAGKIEEVLAGAESVLAGYFVSGKEFVRIFLSGMNSVNISVVPMYLDSVYAGELTTSKYHAVKNLIVLGCVDGVIPGESKDTGLLSENNIRALKAGGINVEPSIAAENAREKFNVYQLLCEPSGNIYLSYPMVNCKGQKNKESRLVTDFQKMFGAEVSEDGAEQIEEQIFTRAQGELFLCGGAEKTEKSDPAYKELSALFYALGGELFKEPTEEKSTDVSKIYGSGTYSCSKIETFYDCPYKHFLSYGLKLKARELPDLMPFDTGTILHAVAEEFLKELSAEADIKKAAADILDKELCKDDYKKIRSAANFAVLKARLASEAEKLCVSIFEGIKNSDFSPAKDMLEYPFEREGLTGYIDRVDTHGGYVRVIDYKTGKIETGFKEIYTGRRLQLFTYLNAAAKKTGLIPAGAYYFPVHNDFEYAEGKSSPRLIGYTLGDAGAVRAADKTLSAEKTESAEIPAKTEIDEGGALSVKSMQKDKILSPDQMRTMLRYADRMIETAKKEIIAGNIKASPFDGACGRCDFSPVCAEKKKEERSAPALTKDKFEGV